MAERAARTCRSVWKRRATRWMLGLGVALVLALAVGIAGASSGLAVPPPPCTAAAPVQVTAGAVSEGRGVAGGTLTTSDGTWSTSPCPPSSYSYKWFRSTDQGAHWS